MLATAQHESARPKITQGYLGPRRDQARWRVQVPLMPGTAAPRQTRTRAQDEEGYFEAQSHGV